MACVICGKSIDFYMPNEYVKLTRKGCEGINKANKLRNMDIADLVFSEDCEILVHKSCRSRHTNPKTIQSAQKRQSSQPAATGVNLRSVETVFNFKTHCFCVAFLFNSHLLQRNQTRPFAGLAT